MCVDELYVCSKTGKDEIKDEEERFIIEIKDKEKSKKHWEVERISYQSHYPVAAPRWGGHRRYFLPKIFLPLQIGPSPPQKK